MPSDAFLRREGELYGLPPDDYVKFSNIQRTSARSKWMREKRIEAQDKGVDVEEHLKREQDKITATLAGEFPGEATQASPMPSTIAGGPVLGMRAPVRVPAPGDMGRAVDLVGDRSPRTLGDIYARWPIGKDPEFLIRVERIYPKVFQNIPCAGFLGEIRTVLTENDFGRTFGGQVYLLEVYGPDPRKKDDNGRPVIKRLSEPVKLTVPVLPPNLAATSLLHESTQQESGMFPQFPGMQAAPNAAEAQIHNKTIDAMGSLVRMEREERDRALRAATQSSEGMFRLIAEQGKESTAILRDQLEKEREDARKVREAALQATGARGGDTAEIIKALSPNKDDALNRLEQTYRLQIETQRQTHDGQMQAMRISHEDVLKTMRERHEGELRRADERYRDLQTQMQRDLDNERSRALQSIEQMRRDSEQRESALREELRNLRVDMKEEADKRVAEVKERYQEQIHDNEKTQERELRTIKEAEGMKLHVTGTVKDSELMQLRDRLAEKDARIGQLETEVEKLSDPVEQIKSLEEKAKALGFVKDDPGAPKNAWEHLAATLGAGAAQALGGIGEWGPGLLDRVQAARSQGMQAQAMQVQQMQAQAAQMQAAQMQAAQMQAQQIQAGQVAGQLPAPQRRRQGTVRWATEDHGVPAPINPSPDLGFASAEAVPAPQAAQPAPAAQAPAEATQGPSIEQQIEEAFPALPAAMGQHFTKAQVVGFIQAMEQHINLGTQPTVFVEGFASQFPAQARAAAGIDPEQFKGYIRSIPGAEESNVLSKAGDAWVEKLWGAFKAKFG